MFPRWFQRQWTSGSKMVKELMNIEMERDIFTFNFTLNFTFTFRGSEPAEARWWRSWSTLRWSETLCNRSGASQSRWNQPTIQSTNKQTNKHKNKPTKKQTDKTHNYNFKFNLQTEMKKQKKASVVVDNKIQDWVKTLPLQGGADLALTAKIASVKVQFFQTSPLWRYNFFNK